MGLPRGYLDLLLDYMGIRRPVGGDGGDGGGDGDDDGDGDGEDEAKAHPRAELALATIAQHVHMRRGLHSHDPNIRTAHRAQHLIPLRQWMQLEHLCHRVSTHMSSAALTNGPEDEHILRALFVLPRRDVEHAHEPVRINMVEQMVVRGLAWLVANVARPLSITEEAWVEMRAGWRERLAEHVDSTSRFFASVTLISNIVHSSWAFLPPPLREWYLTTGTTTIASLMRSAHALRVDIDTEDDTCEFVARMLIGLEDVLPTATFDPRWASIRGTWRARVRNAATLSALHDAAFEFLRHIRVQINPTHDPALHEYLQSTRVGRGTQDLLALCRVMAIVLRSIGDQVGVVAASINAMWRWLWHAVRTLATTILQAIAQVLPFGLILARYMPEAAARTWQALNAAVQTATEQVAAVPEVLRAVTAEALDQIPLMLDALRTVALAVIKSLPTWALIRVYQTGLRFLLPRTVLDFIALWRFVPKHLILDAALFMFPSIAWVGPVMISIIDGVKFARSIESAAWYVIPTNQRVRLFRGCKMPDVAGALVPCLSKLALVCISPAVFEAAKMTTRAIIAIAKKLAPEFDVMGVVANALSVLNGAALVGRKCFWFFWQTVGPLMARGTLSAMAALFRGVAFAVMQTLGVTSVIGLKAATLVVAKGLQEIHIKFGVTFLHRPLLTALNVPFPDPRAFAAVRDRDGVMAQLMQQFQALREEGSLDPDWLHGDGAREWLAQVAAIVGPADAMSAVRTLFKHGVMTPGSATADWELHAGQWFMHTIAKKPTWYRVYLLIQSARRAIIEPGIRGARTAARVAANVGTAAARVAATAGTAAARVAATAGHAAQSTALLAKTSAVRAVSALATASRSLVRGRMVGVATCRLVQLYVAQALPGHLQSGLLEAALSVDVQWYHSASYWYGIDYDAEIQQPACARATALGVQRCGSHASSNWSLDEALRALLVANGEALDATGGPWVTAGRITCNGQQLEQHMLELLTTKLAYLRKISMPLLGMVRSREVTEDGKLTREQCKELFMAQGAAEDSTSSRNARRKWVLHWSVKHHPDKNPDGAATFKENFETLRECINIGD